MKTPEDLFALFDQMEVSTKTFEHTPVFTVAESADVKANIPGGHTKNLFLKTKKGDFFLIVMLGEDRLDLRGLEKALGLGSGKISFASDKYLIEHLGVEPGHVTPFAAINKSARHVRVILDADMQAYDILNFHPLKNHMTTSITWGDLLKFFKFVGQNYEVMQLPKKTEG